MNQHIIDLIKRKESLDKESRDISTKAKQIDEEIREAFCEEDTLYAKVIIKHLPKIIEMIYKKNLFVEGISSWQGVRILMSDGSYRAEINNEEGTIVVENREVYDRSKGNALCEIVNKLVREEILPFCDEHKKDIEQEKN